MEIGKEYQLSFEFQPTQFINVWANVIHLLTDTGMVFASLYRSANSIRLYWISAEVEKRKDFEGVWKSVKIGEWAYFELRQVFNGANFMITIKYNSTLILEEINTLPATVSNVKVYASSSGYQAQPGFIRNVKFGNINQGTLIL